MTSNRIVFPEIDPWCDCPFDDRWTVGALIDWAGKRYSERDALWIKGQGWLTHGEIRLRAARVRGAILANLPKGSKTVACLTRVAAPWYVSIQAVMTSGLAYTVLEPDASDERNRMCLEDCGAELILADASLKDKAEELSHGKRRVVIIDNVQNHADESPVVHVSPESIAAYVFTSGSTGRPKAVIRSQRSLAHAMYCLAENYGYSPKDTMLFPGSPGHIGALNDALSCMIAGFRTLAIDVVDLDLAYIKKLLLENQVSVFAAPPSLLRILLREIGTENLLNRLRLVVASGEARLRSDVGLFHEVFRDVSLWQNYGSTETGPMAAGSYLSKDAQGLGPLPLRRLHLGCEIELVDEKGQLVPTGEMGALRVRSTYLADGYLNSPLEQLARFDTDERGRYFMIGDCGQRSENGDLYIAGRGDRQIKQHGRRLDLADVESAIMADPDWVEAVAVQTAVHAGSETQAIVAVVRPFDFEKASLLKLRMGLEKRLPLAAIPGRFVLVESLPRTTTGKVDLAAVMKLAISSAKVAAIGRGGSPRGACENWIADTWQFILGIDRPGREDRFQDLGGDSLAAVEFSLALEKQFGLSVSIDELVRRPTIAELVKAIQIGGSVKREGIVHLRCNGSGPIYVMFPGAGGHAWIFSALAKAMRGPCDVLALSFADLVAENRGNLKNAIRAEVYRALKDSIHVRPIIMVGYSFGGLMATDVSQWLASQGVILSHLFLLDPSPLDSSPRRETLRGIARRAKRSILRKIGARKSALAIQSPAALHLEKTVNQFGVEMVKSYLDGSVQLPPIKVSWMASDEMAKKHAMCKLIFGTPIEKLDRIQSELNHLDLIRVPGVYQTADWLDNQLGLLASDGEM